MTRNEAESSLVQAVRQALKELALHIEGNPAIVIAGGNVPYLLIPQSQEPHVGTIDIDLVIDETLIRTATSTLGEVLIELLYQQDPKFPFRYTKGVEIDGNTYPVILELLGGGEPPPPTNLRPIPSQDIYVSVIRGMELAHDDPQEITVPNSEETRAFVASLPAFLAMKASSLQNRPENEKHQDAYDIIYCLRNLPGGVGAIEPQLKAALANPLIEERFRLLGELFESVDALGPKVYAENSDDPDDAARLAREAYERVQDLLIRTYW